MSPHDPWRSTPVGLDGSHHDSDPEHSDPVPFSIPEDQRYETRGVLAEGGMGRVHLVYDRRLRRDVALKSARPDGSGLDQRLIQEAWITAQLEHPNIVPVYDAGQQGHSQYYYTMRLIRGRTLEDVLQNASDLDSRLRLLRHYLAACEAVAYAHRNGIVHRDLKPQNILVGEFGETQVADWGVARPLDTPEGRIWTELVFDNNAVATQVGQIVGTPSYMGPEQASGAPPTPAADVFSLGAILYRLVCGHPPYHGDNAADVLEKVRHDSIVPIHVHRPDAPRELCAIVMRAVQRDTTQRYPSAVELAHDVANYLDGRRVTAHEYTTGELFNRLIRAWRLPLLISAIALLVVLTGGVFAVNRIVSERTRALDAEQHSRVAYEEADRSLTEAMLSKARHAAISAQWPEAETLAAYALLLHEDPTARGILMAADGVRPQIQHSITVPPCRALIPDATGTLGLCLATETSLWRLFPNPELVWISPISAINGGFISNQHIVLGGTDNRIWRINAQDASVLGAPIAVHRIDRLHVGHTSALNLWGNVVQFVDYASDTRAEFVVCAQGYNALGAAVGDTRLAVVCDDGAVWIANRKDLQWRRLAGVWPHIAGSILSLSPNETRLVVLQDKGTMAILSTDGLRHVFGVDTELRGARNLDWSTDGELLFAASAYGATRVLSADDGRELIRFPSHFGRYARWIKNHHQVVTLGATRGALWSLPTEFAPQVLGGNDVPGISGMAVSADARIIAAARGNGVVHVYSQSGRTLAKLELGTQTVKRVAFSTNGRRLYTVAMGVPGIRLFDTTSWRSLGRISHGIYRRIEVFSDDSLWVASWTAPPQRLSADGEPIPMDFGNLGICSDMAQDPTTQRFVFLEEGTGRVGLWQHGKVEDRFKIIGQWPGATSVAVVGDRLAIAMADGVILVDVADADLTIAHEHRVHLGTLRPLVLKYLPNQTLMVAGLDPDVLLLDSEGKRIATLVGHSERLGHAVLSESTLWTAGWDGKIRRWGLDVLYASPKPTSERLSEVWPHGLEEALQGTW